MKPINTKGPALGPNAQAKVSQAELEALAADLEITPDELAIIARDWEVSPLFAAEILATDRERRRARNAEPTPAPRRRFAGEEPGRITQDAAEAVLRHQSAAGPTAAERLLPAHMRPAAHGKPAFTSYRSLVVRRISDPLERPLWFYSLGAMPEQVRAWLVSGRKSPDPVERVVCGLLRGEQINRGGFRKIFHVAAIAHFLWYNARRTQQAGFSAYVDATPRGEIARRSAHYFRGQPLHPDTISRYLRELGIILGGSEAEPHLGGILEWEQIPADEAQRHGLHKSTHYLSDGTTRLQATNIYRRRR